MTDSQGPKSQGPEASRDDFTVIHIISEPTIRGGENQVRHLIAGSAELFPAVKHKVLCLKGSAAAAMFAPLCPVIPYSGMVSGIMALRRLCREGADSPVIIDAHSSKGHSLGYFARLSGACRAPLVVHRRVDFVPKSRRKYKSAHIDQFIAISDFIAKVLVDYGIPEQKVATVKSAVSPAPFKGLSDERRRLRQEWLAGTDLPPDTPIIINVGFLTEQKDHATLVRAIERLVPLVGDQPFLCVIAGSGHLEKALSKQIQAAQLKERVRLLGLRQDIPACLAASDIFVMSSAYEGLGTSILDAMHSDLPVAATKVGGIPEMVVDSRTGLLSPPGNSESLAANVARLIQDEKLRESLAARARAEILPQFTTEQMVTGNIATYRQVLGL